MKIKTLLLCTAALSIGAGAAYAAKPAPRHADRLEVAQYEENEQREPCQNYLDVPKYYIANCKAAEVTAEAAQTMEEIRLLPIVQSYTILFDFDQSVLRDAENETLRQVMQEIKKYEPRQITVTGYTDSSGSDDYNQTLSRQREQTVSRALLERGINNHTLERNARGEYGQAVKTADDTKNQQNRRVVIDFRR